MQGVDRGEMMTEEDVRVWLRDSVEKAGTQKAWADTHGISRSYVNDFLAGRRRPTRRLLRAIGAVGETLYRRA